MNLPYRTVDALAAKFLSFCGAICTFWAKLTILESPALNLMLALTNVGSGYSYDAVMAAEAEFATAG